MGERQNRTLEAVGSTPIGSTMKIMNVLNGKTAIITGAARGIGKAIAKLFSEEGANLILVDLDETELKKTAIEIGVESFVADISNAEDAEKAVKTAIDKYGSLDILINNAGITRDALAIRMKPEDFELVLKVNLTGAFLMAKAAARVMMKSRYGKIVNMASVVGVNGNAGQANYAASKGGLISMTKTFAKEFGNRGIRVNAIAPGLIETEMTANLPESALEGFKNKIALSKAAGTPEDVAKATLFLASEDSDYITGTVLPVDGGMLIA